MFCPDTKDPNDLVLMGTRSSHVQKRVEFQILRCDETSPFRKNGDLPCKSRAEIDKYIEDLEVELMIINLKIDYLKYGGQPTFAVQ